MKSVKISKALVYYRRCSRALVCGRLHSTKTHHASTYSSYPTYQATGGPQRRLPSQPLARHQPHDRVDPGFGRDSDL
jgi:hypothetical protein